MRIGIITNNFPTTSETFIVNKVLELCKRGHDVIVFKNQSERNVDLEKLYRLDSVQNLQVVSVNKKAIVGLVQNPLLALSLLQKNRRPISILQQEGILKHKRCDIYHFEFSGIAINYIPLFRKLPGKVIVSCRGTAENVKPLTDSRRKEQLKELFQSVDRIHCVSDELSKTVRSFGADSNKIFINRPAIDPKIFKRTTSYSTHQKVVLSVGRLTFQKGYLTGLLAFKNVLADFPEAKWIIVGDGPSRDEIIYSMHSLNIENSVVLVGKKNRNEILECYNSASVFFLPSVSEGIANTVLEAMSMQLPVVSSKVGGMGEVIDDRINGLLSGNYDHLDMAFNIKRVLADEELAMKLGSNARRKIENEFSLDRQIDIFEKEYKHLQQV